MARYTRLRKQTPPPTNQYLLTHHYEVLVIIVSAKSPETWAVQEFGLKVLILFGFKGFHATNTMLSEALVLPSFKCSSFSISTCKLLLLLSGKVTGIVINNHFT